MNFSLNKINALKLSGISNVLGVDLSQDNLNLVEIRSHGGILNKFHSKYKVANSFTVEFEKGLPSEEKGKLLAEELKKRGIKTRFCVSAIPSTAARTVTAEIPPDVEDIEAWISENCDKLVRVPIPLKELAFSYEIVPATDTQTRHCRISFTREAERKEYISVFSAAGLHLLSLGLSSGTPSGDPLVSALCPEGYTGDPAAELAIKGFLPELRSLDFLIESEKKKTSEEKDKSLFYRAALGLGALLLLLLGVQFGLNTYLQSVSDKVDERLLQVGPVYSEVAALSKQVGELGSELNDSGGNRSDAARVLHDIAEATPNGVWLYKLDIDWSDAGRGVVDLFGFARTNDLAASYLGSLQQDKRFSNVQVVRIGAPSEAEAVSFANRGIRTIVTFELKMRAGK